jgi:hypothetical protein
MSGFGRVRAWWNVRLRRRGRRVASIDVILCELHEALEGRSPGRSVGTLRVAVVEDFSNDFLFRDESEDFHFGAASRAGQGVDLVDTVDELSPSLVRSAWIGTRRRSCLLSRLILLTTGM